MKKLIFIWIMLSLCSISGAQIRKSPLRVLYVGGSGNTDVSKGNPKDIEERMASFEQMLKQYFETVVVVNAREYTPGLSGQYDVTVMDGTPQPLSPAIREKDASGQIVKYKPATYLPEDFDCPMVTIAQLGEVLGRTIGLKTDWYCLCLDADAHHFRAEHPIFHGPFPVKMTIRMKPTPPDAFHYAYYADGPLPDSIPMWQVQTKGYATHKGFRIGMVARPWGFEDSPDAEYISSGVCAKTLDAVAIGRHGNFLHWGFAASPADMTEEAKAVFANAIVYIAGFAQKAPIARKYNDRIATREYLKELKYLSTRKAWEERLKMDDEFDRMMRKDQQATQEKKARGEKLTQEEERMLDFQPAPQMTYADFVKRYQKQAFERFGTDEQAYADYYDSNRDYFYGGQGMYVLTVDEDVKSLGIANSDLRLLDAAICLLEKGEETEKAERILTRYTLCRFHTPREWRNWYETYKQKLFFTEAGGWLFLVNSQENVPGNNYHVQDEKPLSAQLPQPEATDDQHPVQLAAGVEQTENGNREVVIRVKIHHGYHIYAHVADEDPFIATTIEIKLPAGYEAKGKLQRPSFKSFNEKGTTVYEEEAVFRQEITGSGKGEIVCTVGYQCCDAHICMPPVEKECTFKIE